MLMEDPCSGSVAGYKRKDLKYKNIRIIIVYLV